MPSIDGGDQCSRAYAPHMWIGDYFVANTGRTIGFDGWTYRVGRTSSEEIVCERRRQLGLAPTVEKVSCDEIPRPVLELIGDVSFKRDKKERGQFAADVNAEAGR